MKKTKPKADQKRSLLKKVLKAGVKMQYRFKAEPTFGPTGKGFMLSEGVADFAVKKPRKPKSSEKH